MRVVRHVSGSPSDRTELQNQLLVEGTWKGPSKRVIAP